MNLTEPKYVGTVEYHLVYAELIQAARYQGMTTYQAIAQLMGLPLSGNYMGKEVGQILGEIVDAEIAQVRPMISAVVVSTTRKPSKGFFGLARQLGRLTAEGGEAEKTFWEKELAAVHKAWARKFGDSAD